MEFGGRQVAAHVDSAFGARQEDEVEQICRKNVGCSSIVIVSGK